MVGRVLRNHQIVSREKKGYRLLDFDTLTPVEIDQLIALCQQRLNEYLEKRGKQIWQHRTNSAGYISGTLRYEVLKRAQFHCELCGISADLKALEVDHIIPRNHGGEDELSNLQALCFSCNAMKRDRDTTDFRAVKASYAIRHPNCQFCQIPPERMIGNHPLAYAICEPQLNSCPQGVVVPRRHVSSYFELSRPEINACNELLKAAKDTLLEENPSIGSFSIEIRGEELGPKSSHCRIHLILQEVEDRD